MCPKRFASRWPKSDAPISGNTTSLGNDYDGANCGDSGSDVVFVYTVPAGETLQIDVDGDFDMTLSTAEDCAQIDGDACIANVDTGGTDETIQYDNSAGAGDQDVYVLLDGWNGQSGDYTIMGTLLAPEACGDGVDNDLDGDTDCFDSDCDNDILCTEICNNGVDDDGDGDLDCLDAGCDGDILCAEDCSNGVDDDQDGDVDCDDSECFGDLLNCPENPGETCENAQILTLDTPTASDTSIQRNDYDGTCGHTGPDEAWSVVVPAGATVTITVDSTFDAVVAIAEDCDQANTDTCFDEVDAGNPETISYDNTAGVLPVTITVLVDGWNGQSGTYTITATSP